MAIDTFSISLIWIFSPFRCVSLFTLFNLEKMAFDVHKKTQTQTPMQEFILHLQTNFGYKSENDRFWLDKEQKSIEKAYDEGVEDGGFFGNGKDYFTRTFE